MVHLSFEHLGRELVYVAQPETREPDDPLRPGRTERAVGVVPSESGQLGDEEVGVRSHTNRLQHPERERVDAFQAVDGGDRLGVHGLRERVGHRTGLLDRRSAERPQELRGQIARVSHAQAVVDDGDDRMAGTLEQPDRAPEHCRAPAAARADDADGPSARERPVRVVDVWVGEVHGWLFVRRGHGSAGAGDISDHADDPVA
ncbi:hypothetical protein ACPPVW_10465 [Leifsonia sp. McL0607]|uniref:hypothetical protein n=1 Tax=Leifsonia sp. McL0607 TaxID=3415672 RepID=UPI003CE88915